MKSSKSDPYLKLISDGIADRQSLKIFQKNIGYRFRSEALLVNAFVHRSFSNDVLQSNERLEFLGDSVLSLVISSFLYENFPARDEGFLTRRRAALVCEESLYEIACGQGMDRLLIVGKSEQHSSGRFRKAPVADSVEALIGAVYLDGGWGAAQKLILRIFPVSPDRLKRFDSLDPKTALQMFVQRQKKILPRYRLVRKTGPDHDAVFFVEVLVGDECLGKGSGSSRKTAEIRAAAEAVALLRKKNLWIDYD